MIYGIELEPEPEEIEVGSSINLDGRFITARAYLKGMHYHDLPTWLMPQDEKWLNAARQFYFSLSEEDQRICDSFSDKHIAESMDLNERNRRFHQLAQLLLCQMSETHFFIAVPSD